MVYINHYMQYILCAVCRSDFALRHREERRRKRVKIHKLLKCSVSPSLSFSPYLEAPFVLDLLDEVEVHLCHQQSVSYPWEALAEDNQASKTVATHLQEGWKDLGHAHILLQVHTKEIYLYIYWESSNSKSKFSKIIRAASSPVEL